MAGYPTRDRPRRRPSGETPGLSGEIMIATSLALFACFLGIAAIALNKTQTPAPRVLIYDGEAMQAQMLPYVQARQDPIAVAKAAVAAAVAQGFVVIDSQLGIKGPAAVQLQLADFVEPGSEVGKLAIPLPALQLPGTTPVPAGAAAQAPRPEAAAPVVAGAPTGPGADVADFARALTGAGGFSAAPAQPSSSQ